MSFMRDISFILFVSPLLMCCSAAPLENSYINYRNLIAPRFESFDEDKQNDLQDFTNFINVKTSSNKQSVTDKRKQNLFVEAKKGEPFKNDVVDEEMKKNDNKGFAAIDVNNQLVYKTDVSNLPLETKILGPDANYGNGENKKYTNFSVNHAINHLHPTSKETEKISTTRAGQNMQTSTNVVEKKTIKTNDYDNGKLFNVDNSKSILNKSKIIEQFKHDEVDKEIELNKYEDGVANDETIILKSEEVNFPTIDNKADYDDRKKQEKYFADDKAIANNYLQNNVNQHILTYNTNTSEQSNKSEDIDKNDNIDIAKLNNNFSENKQNNEIHALKGNGNSESNSDGEGNQQPMNHTNVDETSFLPPDTIVNNQIVKNESERIIQDRKVEVINGEVVFVSDEDKFSNQTTDRKISISNNKTEEHNVDGMNQTNANFTDDNATNSSHLKTDVDHYILIEEKNASEQTNEKADVKSNNDVIANIKDNSLVEIDVNVQTLVDSSQLTSRADNGAEEKTKLLNDYTKSLVDSRDKAFEKITDKSIATVQHKDRFNKEIENNTQAIPIPIDEFNFVNNNHENGPEANNNVGTNQNYPNGHIITASKSETNKKNDMSTEQTEINNTTNLLGENVRVKVNDNVQKTIVNLNSLLNEEDGWEDEERLLDIDEDITVNIKNGLNEHNIRKDLEPAKYFQDGDDFLTDTDEKSIFSLDSEKRNEIYDNSPRYMFNNIDKSLSASYSFSTISFFMVLLFICTLFTMCGGWSVIRHLIVIILRKSYVGKDSWSKKGYQSLQNAQFNQKYL